MKNMITGNLRLPRDDPEETAREVSFMVDKRRSEIEKLLDKNELGESVRLKLKIESQFLSPSVRSVYQKVMNRIVDGFHQDHKSLTLF